MKTSNTQVKSTSAPVAAVKAPRKADVVRPVFQVSAKTGKEGFYVVVNDSLKFIGLAQFDGDKDEAYAEACKAMGVPVKEKGGRGKVVAEKAPAEKAKVSKDKTEKAPAEKAKAGKKEIERTMIATGLREVVADGETTHFTVTGDKLTRFKVAELGVDGAFIAAVKMLAGLRDTVAFKIAKEDLPVSFATLIKKSGVEKSVFTFAE